MGGLGNQLFQIFATISHSIKTKNPFKFLNKKTLGGNGCTLRYTFWESFLVNLKPFLIDELPELNVIRENGFEFNDLSIYESHRENILIYGYFQSYKYFHDYYENICKIINLEKMKDTVLIKTCNVKEDFINIVSIHFRIGDYKNIQDFHPIMTYDYYFRALTHIKNNYQCENLTILYFCENTDYNDVHEKIQKLEKEFETFKFIRGNNTLEDWEQLLLMSCCHHNVIANSSFSWWAAYFNSNEDKIVCYPSIWFGPQGGNLNTKDLCPTEWVKIQI